MTKVHNKKRNVGLIYEQTIQYVCNRLIENDEKSAQTALNIIKKYFKEGTQLNKEYRLFKALATTKGISDHLATAIIKEAKKACNAHFDNDKLEKEKSSLIKELNYNLGKDTIFNESVKSYKTYATIQTLINEWRDENRNFDRITEFEINLHENLTKKPVVENNKEPQKYDKLTHNLMKNIFKEKYKSILNENQQKLISNYINEEKDELKEKFVKIKKKSLVTLEKYINESDNNFIKSKYKNVKENILNLNENEINKESLNKFLTLLKLEEELLKGK